MVYTLIGGTLIIVSLYCLTNWWKNRQNRLIAEGEKLMNEPNPYPSPGMETNHTQRILDGMDLTLDFRNADGGLTHGVELADFNVSRIEGRVLEDVTMDEIQINEHLSRSLGESSSVSPTGKPFSKKPLPNVMEGVGRAPTEKGMLPGVGPTGSNSHASPHGDAAQPSAGFFKDGTGDSSSNDRNQNAGNKQPTDEYVEEPTLLMSWGGPGGYPQQGGFGQPNPGFPGGGYPNPQPGFGGPGYGQPGFGGPQPGFGGPQPGFGGPQPGYGMPQPGFGGPQPGYGMPQPGYGAPQPGFGGPQPGYGVPQPGFGGPGSTTQLAGYPQGGHGFSGKGHGHGGHHGRSRSGSRSRSRSGGRRRGKGHHHHH